ncbi:MAG: hypothetical protein D6797_01180 [Bdellovibrio sp.]|nr:MAG: hypothetical protein D6797_01180 [Bdellovibrio sp.]
MFKKIVLVFLCFAFSLEVLALDQVPQMDLGKRLFQLLKHLEVHSHPKLKLMSKKFFRVKFECSSFGVEVPVKGEKITFFTNKVPYQEGASYLWGLCLRGDSLKKIRLKEVVVAPQGMKWRVKPKKGERVYQKGRVLSYERDFQIRNNLVWTQWVVKKGDPKGKYLIKVYYRNHLIEEFPFVIDDVKRKPETPSTDKNEQEIEQPKRG